MFKIYQTKNRDFLNRIHEFKQKGIFGIFFGFLVLILIIMGALYCNSYANRFGRGYIPLDNRYCEPKISFFKGLLDHREIPEERNENELEGGQYEENEFYEGNQKQETAVSPCPEVHLLGTDGEGRDIFASLLAGCKVVLYSGIVALIITLLLGTSFGIFAGYLSRKPLTYFYRLIFSRREKLSDRDFNSIFLGDLINLFPTFINIFPRLILIAIILTVRKIDIWSVTIAIGLINVPKLSYIIKDKIEHLKNQEFIEAAQELGVSQSQIILKHILWYNCRSIILVQTAFIFAEVILVESSLSYLGHGLNYSWGKMVAMEKGLITSSMGIYWPVFFPAAAIVTTIIAFHSLGDGLSRWLQIKR